MDVDLVLADNTVPQPYNVIGHKADRLIMRYYQYSIVVLLIDVLYQPEDLL